MDQVHCQETQEEGNDEGGGRGLKGEKAGVGKGTGRRI